MLIQDEEVGVKCSLKRGCLASQACTSLVLEPVRNFLESQESVVILYARARD